MQTISFDRNKIILKVEILQQKIRVYAKNRTRTKGFRTLVSYLLC